MAKFLNTDLLNQWIPRLINETEKELVIIVPYIKTSGLMYKHLWEANKRGVETTLIYKENKLSAEEKKKFEALDNLNLMSHPNVHAKCYYNEKYLIIGSMNLYEYSERNNREMGVLLHKQDIEELGDVGFNTFSDSDDLFEEAKKEIQAILRSATMEKPSRETANEGFEMDIIKSQRELCDDQCKILNKKFIHKKFSPKQIRNEWKCVCENYYDHIDVVFDYRACFEFNYVDNRVENIFKQVIPNYHEFRFEGYKFYWNSPQQPIYLYSNSRHKMWHNVQDEQHIELMKNGIDEVITFLKPYLRG